MNWHDTRHAYRPGGDGYCKWPCGQRPHDPIHADDTAYTHCGNCDCTMGCEGTARVCCASGRCEVCDSTFDWEARQ